MASFWNLFCDLVAHIVGTLLIKRMQVHQLKNAGMIMAKSSTDI
jgi:hypothetical protein